jgi:predicted transcriptional regulator
MGHMTISLKEDKEQRLRALAKQKYGPRKGALSQTIEDLLELDEKEARRRRAIQSFLARGKKGYHLGKIAVKHRSELYDRKIFPD